MRHRRRSGHRPLPDYRTSRRCASADAPRRRADRPGLRSSAGWPDGRRSPGVARRTDRGGRVGDAQLSELMSRARALIVPNVEEFGIAAVEAQAAGRPVLAPDAGGTRETVIDGVTGVLYPAGNCDALAEAMRHEDFARFDPQVIRHHALGFRPEVFRSRLIAEVARVSGLGLDLEPPVLTSEPSPEPAAAAAV
ncbi:MAG: glycosyltransferase [Solirubrobacteraceae bacterium]